MDAKLKIPAALAAALLVSQAAHAATRCSVEVIEQLPVEQQMKQYSLCVSLMEKRIQLLKKQAEARKLMKGEGSDAGSGAASASAPGSSVSPQVNLPPVPNPMGSPMGAGDDPVVSAIEGAGDRLRATLRWPDGSTYQVSKGMTVKGYKVLDVTVEGVKARKVRKTGYKAKKGDVVFIPVGTGSSLPNMAGGAISMGGMNTPPVPPVVYPQQ